jgi:hypothetical protein
MSARAYALPVVRKRSRRRVWAIRFGLFVFAAVMLGFVFPLVVGAIIIRHRAAADPTAAAPPARAEAPAKDVRSDSGGRHGQMPIYRGELHRRNRRPPRYMV